MEQNKDGQLFNFPKFKSTSGCEHCFCQEEIVYDTSSEYTSTKSGKLHIKCCMCGTRKVKTSPLTQ